jgi:hypothetical protein
MKFTAPKITRPIAFKEYAEEYGAAAIQVWVNPPAEMVARRWRLLQEYSQRQAEDNKEFAEQAELARKRKQPAPKQADPTERAWFKDWKNAWVGWFAELWSQAADAETHWTVDEMLTLEQTDPKLARYLIERTLELVDDLKKA